MSGSDAAWTEAASWFAKAEQDIRTARLCLLDSGDLIGVAAYHCQQAAEKLVKGLLVGAGATFRKTHELDELVAAALPHYPDLASLLDPLRPLSFWCWAFRYPSLDPLDAVPPTTSEIWEVISDLEKLRSHIGNDRTGHPDSC